MRRTALVLVLALMTWGAHAAESDEATDPVGEEKIVDVVVTTTLEGQPAAESAASVTVITREEIRRQEARQVIDVLRDVPGLEVVQTGSPGHTASLFVRGTDSNQMLVLLDGVPLNDPYFGGFDLSSLSTEYVERIEVVRGPFSALYGSDAIGGVVHIITRRGEEGVRFEASAEGGSDSYGRVEATLDGGSGRFDYFVSGSWRDGDGIFANDDFEETVGLVRAGVALEDGMHLGLLARATDTSLGIPFAGTSPTPWTRYDTDERTLIVPFTHAVSDAFDYRVELSHIDASYTYDDLGSEYPYAATTDTTSDRLSVRATWAAGSHHLSWGGELEKIEVDNEDNFAVNLDGESNDSWGVFVQDSMEFGDLSLVAGVRYDDHDTFGSTVSPRVSAAYLVGSEGQGVRLRAGYGEAFRAPTVGELYFPGSGNPDLEAEESRSFELGVGAMLADGRFRADLTWFDNRVDQLIEFDLATFVFGNIGEARMKGLELGLAADLGKGWGINASYTHLDATDEITGEPLKRRPDNKATLVLNYDWQGRLNADAKALWVDDRPDADPDLFTDIVLDGYTRIDLAASYRAWDWLTPFVRVENALDEDYEEAAGFPAPGRSVVGGLRFTVR